MTAALVATVVLVALAALQVAVAAGAPLGRFVWGGRHEVLPRGLRVGSVLSVLLYAVVAWVLLRRAGADAVPAWLSVAAWVVAGYFVLGTALNAISRSRPERFTMTPVCVVLAACSIVVASAA